MKKIFLLIILAFMTVSCAGVSDRQVTGNKELDQAKDQVDTSCSYFYFLWGSGAEREKSFAEAQEAYEKALVCDRNAVFVMKRLSILLTRMGKPNQAIMWMQKVVEQHPDDLEARFWMARIYVLMERADKSIIIYREILADDPENVDALYYLGALYFSNRQYVEARDRLEKLVDIYPESFAAHRLLARLYREMRYLERSVGEYNVVLELAWNIPLALEAAEVLQQVDPISAISLYGQILEDDVTNEKARNRLTRLYLLNGEVDKAVKLLEDLRPYSSEVNKIDFALGRILLENDRYIEAIEKFQSSLHVAPDFQISRFFLARAYFINKDLNAALKILQDVPTDYKAYNDVIILLLRIYDKENDYAAMETLLTERIADPVTQKAGLYVLLASIYHQQQKDDLAKEIFEQGELEFPNDIKLKFEQGVFLEKLGEHDEAMLKMVEVLELDPDHALALNYIGYSWADNGINLPKALEYIQKAVNQRPEDGFIRDSLGWVLFRLGRLDEAVSELERAVEMAPEDPTIHEHLGDVYNKKGNYEDALRIFKQAESLYRDGEKKSLVEEKIISLVSREEARERLEKLVGLYPKLYGPHKLLARFYKAMQYQWRAAAEYNSALQFGWNNPLALEAALFLRPIDPGAAVFLYGQILEDDENNQEARHRLTQIYLLNGEVDKAVKLLEDLRPYSTEVSKIDFSLGRIFWENDRYGRAIEKFLSALKEDPACPDCQFFLARAYWANEELVPAEKAFKRAILDSPENTDLLFEYGMFLEETGDPNGAMLKMVKVLELDPNHALALNYIGYNWADKGVNLPKALEYIQKAVELRPEDGIVRDSLGWVLFRLGELDKSISELLLAIKRAPDDPAINEHLGFAYHQKGNLLSALRLFEKAASLYRAEEEVNPVREK